MDELRRKYAGFHLLRVFFQDLDEWRRVSRFAGIESTLSQIEYDYLFRGTHSGIYIPVWASACLSGMDILLNEITLEAVIMYKTNGFSPTRMDGNPPDYIGEQFRFLEYLSRCAMQGEPGCAEAAAAFIDDFTLDTVRVMGRALRDSTDNDEVLAVLALAEKCVAGGGADVPDSALESFDSWSWTKNPPLPIEDEHIVSHASFNDCGNKCKTLSTVREGCVLSISWDKSCDFKFSGCPRGAAYRPTFLTSRRLRYPMERVGERGEGKFRRITWDEAVQKVASTIDKSRQFGPGSRYVMAGAGICSVMSGSTLTKRLLAADGGHLNYYSSYSIGAALPVLPRMFGQLNVGNHEDEMLRSKLLILWGNNLVTNHFGSAQKRVLMQAKERGVKIIVIDPRQSDTVLAAADEWIGIRPSTDSALADAMCWVIREKKLYDREFIDRFCVGFDDEHLPDGVPAGESYFAYLSGVKDGIAKTPGWAEAITGIPRDVIERLAVEYATANHACILPGLGPQRTLNGEQTYRSIMTLACLVGGIGKPGGGVIIWSHPAGPKPFMPMHENPYKTAIPAFQWWRSVECPETIDKKRGLFGAEKLDTRVRFIFSIASGMLLSQHSDINHTLRILRRDDLVDSIILTDIFMTPSAKAADLLLPAPSFFETENISSAWGGEDYHMYNHAAIEPLFGTKLELEWLIQVADKLGLRDRFCEGRETLDDWLRASWDAFMAKAPGVPDYNTFKQLSFALNDHKLPHLTFIENIEQCVPFKTPSGKIEIFIKELYDRGDPEVPGIPAYTPVEEGPSDALRARYPLQLIGYHSKRRTHSIHDENAWLEELEPPCVWIHPDDAAERGITDGDTVEIFNERGRVRIPAYVTRRIIRGAAAMCEGAWYTPDEKGTDTRGAINVLTMSHKATPLGNSNPQHTNLVEIEKP